MKVEVNLLSIPFWSDFISKWHDYSPFSWINFQSHFGLILSRHTASGISSNHEIFQSHFGLILSCITKQIIYFVSILSIPFWSDFIKRQDGSQTSCTKSFNPILVWFYLWFAPIESISPYTFQSHFGLILSKFIVEAEGY